MAYEQIEVRRDCPAVQIPQGNSVVIPAGAAAVVTQSLGGSYTVQVASWVASFASRAAMPMRSGCRPARARGARRRRRVRSARTGSGRCSTHVYDPEIPVNIVDLGLVYDLRIEPSSGGSSRVEVRMTLTAPGCGMGQTIAMDARQRIESLPGVAEADVQVVWDPPWNPHMISPEGRAKLGME